MKPRGQRMKSLHCSCLNRVCASTRGKRTKVRISLRRRLLWFAWTCTKTWTSSSPTAPPLLRLCSPGQKIKRRSSATESTRLMKFLKCKSEKIERQQCLFQRVIPCMAPVLCRLETEFCLFHQVVVTLQTFPQGSLPNACSFKHKDSCFGENLL